jgi:hypothetical protein
MKSIRFSVAIICVFCATATSTAAEHYVAVDGQAAGAGTEAAPWDLESTLLGAQPVAPGDTVWVRGGTYKHLDRQPGTNGYAVRLAGAEGKPIHIRPIPGDRVTIDGGLRVESSSKFLWIWELEIIVSENLTGTRVAKDSGSHPKDLARPWGSLNILGGEHCKYIHLVIHDNAQGIGFWKPAINSEVPLSVGYTAPDSEDCIVQGNTIIRNGLSIRGFSSVTQEDNFIWRGQQKDEVPKTATVFVRPSKYDPNRANLAIVNRPKSKQVEADLATSIFIARMSRV